MSTQVQNTKPTVLITGLNGYLAGRTAELALKEGWRIRGTVRNKAAGHKVKMALCSLGYSADDIEVVGISDMCDGSALEAAANGCHAMLHLAFPMIDLWTLPPLEVIRMAVESIECVLDAAQRAGPTMKSVVMLSSSAALFDMPFENRHYTENDWNTTSEHIVHEQGNDAGGFHAYLAGKTAAEKLFWKYRTECRPSFAMTALQPTYFIGAPLIPWKTPADIPYSNSDFWKVVSGEEIPGPMNVYNDTIDIRDVARVALWSARNPEKSDGQRFVCSSAVGGGQAIADVLRRRMPCLKTQRGQPGQGYLPAYTPRPGVGGFDGRTTVSVTGQDWIPYEESVVDIVQFLRRYLQ